MISTVANDNLLQIEPRVTFGGGAWLDYVPRKTLSNGLSVFFIEEYEKGGEARPEWTPRLSLRNYFHIKAGQNADIALDMFVTPSITNPADYRASVIPSLTLAVTDILSLNFYLSAEYTSEPRNPSVKKYDITNILGLTVNLGSAEPATKVENKT